MADAPVVALPGSIQYRNVLNRITTFFVSQIKRFVGAMEDPGAADRIPTRILFDMHLGPVTPSVNVNVIPAN